MEALRLLCSQAKPPWRMARGTSSRSVYYGFGDASGSAFGATLQHAFSNTVHYEYGQWLTSVTDGESSNWREFTNLVEFLEAKGDSGDLDGAEVFMFTDNSTTEGAFWKGTSSSRKLLSLVLRLRQLEMKTGMILHIIHVSGKRMIESGVDGLSRGDHSSGMMQGHDIRTYIPLHLSAFDRSPALEKWMRDITEGTNPTFLDPNGWFAGATTEGTFVWSPPPAAAEVVVERLGVAKHKRPNSLHFVVVPRLMTGYWRKHLTKATDFHFQLDSPPLWDLKHQFEPVLIFVSFPFLPHRPAFNWKANLIERFGRILFRGDLLQADLDLQRTLLRQLCIESGSLPPL